MAAMYLLMSGPAAVELGKQPGMKLSGGFPSLVRRRQHFPKILKYPNTK
jgi:hypothetical protein